MLGREEPPPPVAPPELSGTREIGVPRAPLQAKRQHCDSHAITTRAGLPGRGPQGHEWQQPERQLQAAAAVAHCSTPLV